VAVERDGDLLPLLEETTSGCRNLSLVHADAVLVPSIVWTRRWVRPARSWRTSRTGAATVVLRFFQELRSLASATVMVQAEVADRMEADPGCKDFGAYTVKLRLLAQPVGGSGAAHMLQAASARGQRGAATRSDRPAGVG